ncbi:lytic transglycosylase domain-containing protein [Fusibacter sp. JL216-2]|uniref:lytic transglycosylase domain-containing protein n=1 Tax=Fusibacter sp. JL216-2 TaxID=3071453 RepID=UPI003D32DBC3
MKKRIIALTAALGLLFSSISFGDVPLELSAFNSQAVIDGHAFQNEGLQYPFLYGSEKVYMPLDYQTLRTLGYLSSWDDSNNTFKIYTSTNKTYNLRTSEVKWTNAQISAVQSTASLNFMEEKMIEKSLVEANGILYLELSDKVLESLDWAAAYHPFLGLQMSVVENSADLVSLDDADIAYYDGLARFMMTRNSALTYKKAAEYAKYVKESSLEYDIDEIWIMAMLWQESWYDENCEYKGALGLMQIMESTGRALGLSRDQLFDPQLSIKYGTKYLRDQMNAFDNNLDLATLAYNQGPVRVQKGTYRTWYLEEVKEKYAVIENWLIQEGIDLTALAESGGDAGDADEDSPE